MMRNVTILSYLCFAVFACIFYIGEAHPVKHLITTIAICLRWLVRTRADISLRPSGLVRPRTGIKLRPIGLCTDSNEGDLSYSSQYLYQAKPLWICKNKEWIPYKLVPSIGSIKSMSAQSCKHIKAEFLANHIASPISGVYWVQGMQVFCDMELDGGGWTLVWQHSYFEDLPLITDMAYFSTYHRPCSIKASGWCNTPNKARFNPTEQMIVAYHRGTVVYAYASLFNRLIDTMWRGAILCKVDLRKIVDRCTSSNGVHPAPENAFVIGVTFDKKSPNIHAGENCDTYRGSLTHPSDCRWENCQLPSSISSNRKHTQMTVAIFVR